MEGPDYCFAFNFLPANSTSTARGCCVRPAGTSPERGQHTHTPHTQTPSKQAPAPSREHRRAALGISKRSPSAAAASGGAGACGRRAPAFWLPSNRQRGGARRLPARPAVGSARPGAGSPRLLRNLITHAGKVPRQHLESQRLERKRWPRLESWGSCFSPQALASKPAKDALLGESCL